MGIPSEINSHAYREQYGPAWNDDIFGMKGKTGSLPRYEPVHCCIREVEVDVNNLAAFKSGSYYTKIDVYETQKDVLRVSILIGNHVVHDLTLREFIAMGGKLCEEVTE